MRSVPFRAIRCAFFSEAEFYESEVMKRRLLYLLVFVFLVPLHLHAEEPVAELRSASFVTQDLDASVEFYTTYLGYRVLGRSEITAEKSRRVVGAKGDETVRYASLAPSKWTKENSAYAGVSFIEIEGAPASPFDQDAGRASRAGELVLAHRVWNIDEIAKRMAENGVPVVAPLGLSGSGKSRSMAVLDPNGVRVEMYEY